LELKLVNTLACLRLTVKVIGQREKSLSNLLMHLPLKVNFRHCHSRWWLWPGHTVGVLLADWFLVIHCCL